MRSIFHCSFRQPLLRFIVALGLLTGLFGRHLEANAEEPSKTDQFLSKISQNYAQLPAHDEVIFEVGVTQYVPLSVLMASQPSFTSIKALAELDEAHVRFLTDDQLSFHQGRALLPPTKYAVGIAYNGKVYLVDGHHKALLSLYFGATDIPVKIIADWSSKPEAPLSEAEFRHRMVEQFYAYPNDAEGEPVDHFYEINQLQDEPNLYLARLLIQKVKTTISLESMQLLEVSGSNRPLILKLNEGLPFIEFYIAALLKKNDIKYDSEWGKHIPPRTQKKIRTLLKKESRETDTPLRDAILLDDFTELDTHERDLDRDRLKIIYKHLLKKVNCNTMFTSQQSVYVGENH